MKEVIAMKRAHRDPLLHSSSAATNCLEAEDASCSIRSFQTKDTDASSAFSSSAPLSSFLPSAAGATETELKESRHLVRTLRREAKARATDLAWLRIQAEALGAEREEVKKCRDMCESAMAEVRDLRAERDELREILLNVMQQEWRQDSTNVATLAEKELWLDEKDQDELQGRRRTSNFSSLSDDDDEEQDEKQDDDDEPNGNESLRQVQKGLKSGSSDGNNKNRTRQRRSSLLEGVGAFFSGVVKNAASASMNSLQKDLTHEVEPQGQARLVVPQMLALPNRQQQRRASAVVSSAGGTPLCSHTGSEERSGLAVELDDIKKLGPGRAARHSSMPQLSYGGNDHSASSLSSLNVPGGRAQSDKDDKSTEFSSWEETCQSLQQEESSTTHPKERDNGRQAPEQTPENAAALTGGSDASRFASSQRSSWRGSSSSDRRRFSSSCSCPVALRRDTEKDVEDFVASMMLSGALGELMDDEEIAADYDNK